MDDKIESIDKFLNIVDDLFGNHWDVDLENYDKERFYSPNNNYIDLILHYPRLLVTNKNNIKMYIYDLFVKLSFRFFIYDDKEEGVHIDYPNVARTTFPSIQYLSGYVWSHVHQKPLYNCGWELTCFGESDLKNTINYINNKESYLTVNDFKYLLNSVAAHFEYESLEGGPYIRMTDVLVSIQNNHYLKPNNSNLTNNIMIAKDYVADNMDKINIMKVISVDDDNGYTIDANSVNRLLLEKLDINEFYNISENRLKSSVARFTGNITGLPESRMIFRNKNIPLIVDSDLDLFPINSNLSVTVNPVIMLQVINKIFS